MDADPSNAPNDEITATITVSTFPLPFLVLLATATALAQAENPPFMRGADISTTPEIEDAGGRYTLKGVEKEVLDIFRENGANYLRLRLWHTPSGGYCGLPKTLAFAGRIKAKGFKWLLDFHYSDWWADPGKQTKPAAWAALSYAALKESVYTYTRDVLAAFRAQGSLPDMVQIGNEIIAGMLWPDGKVPGSNPSQQWFQLGELVKAGIRGARDGANDSLLTIMIHIDRGGDNAGSRWFYDNLIAQGVQFDVIGLSYYPWWHGTLTQLQNNLNDLSVRYQKPIVLVEIGYPWTTQWVNDGVGNVSVDPSKLIPGYGSTPQGQKAFVSAISSILKQTPGGRGVGFFYWEPAYISVPGVGSAWEHVAMFDFAGSALTSITSYTDFDSLSPVNIRLRFNTATHTDTLKPTGVLQIRGEVKGVGSDLMPDGTHVTWDAYSQLMPSNTGGDYWESGIQMYPGDRLEYKMWTGHTSSSPTFLRLGWEGPITPHDGSNVNARVLVAGSSDTTFLVEFYNSRGVAVDQFWTPIAPKPDSVGVLFRVNMNDLQASGVFDPAVHGPLAVRGDSLASEGVLSWSRSLVALLRETTSVANGSFWSGVAYFPRHSIAPATPVRYRFYVENNPSVSWESAIGDRTFDFPAGDTTLPWRFFNDRNAAVAVGRSDFPLPACPRLEQNYPNPFNPSTIIGARWATAGDVTLVVSDLLGKEVATLARGRYEPGAYTFLFDAHDLASGVYIYRLTAGGIVQTRRMLLIR